MMPYYNMFKKLIKTYILYILISMFLTFLLIKYGNISNFFFNDGNGLVKHYVNKPEVKIKNFITVEFPNVVRKIND